MGSRSSKQQASSTDHLLIKEIFKLCQRMTNVPASSLDQSEIERLVDELVERGETSKSVTEDKNNEQKDTFIQQLAKLIAQNLEQMGRRKLKSSREKIYKCGWQFSDMVSELSVLLYKHIPAKDFILKKNTFNNDKKDKKRDEDETNEDYVLAVPVLIAQGKHKPVKGKNFLLKLCSKKGSEKNTSVNNDKKDKKKNEDSELPVPVELIAQGKHKPVKGKNFLLKLCSKKGSEKNTPVNNDKKEKKKCHVGLVLPVQLIAQGGSLPTSSSNLEGEVSSAGCSKKKSSSTDDRDNEFRQVIMRNVAAIPELKYEELTSATNNWSATNLIGQGGFGEVFKGEWMLLPVAVKRLRKTDERNTELVRELCLNQYRHDNIVPLYGYSCEGPKVCLVYQLLTGGSLGARLHHTAPNNLMPLTWPERLKIAHGVARALNFLHTMMSKPLIHGDIKPANIFLDECLTPKIGDFGLARNGPDQDSRTHLTVSRLRGTRPYLPDDDLRSRCLSPAVDVFSYGVMMLEIATGLKPIDETYGLLTDLLRKGLEEGRDTALYEDCKLHGTEQSNPQHCREFIAIGVQCTRLHRSERPKMLEVYKRLNIMMDPEKRLLAHHHSTPLDLC